MHRLLARRNAVLGMVNLAVVLVLLAAAVSCGGAAAPSGGATPAGGAAAPAAPAKVVTIRYATYTPPNYWAIKAEEWWAKEVERRSGGKVTFEFFHSESLLKATDILPGVGKGLADMGWAASGYYSALLPLTGGTELPYQVVAPDTKMRALNELYSTFPPFRDEWDAHNVKVVHFSAIGPTILHSKMSIGSLEDLKGKRIRGMGMSNKALEMLGAVPVALAAPEMYTALERGTIDGYAGIPFDSISALKFQEVAKYLTDPGLGQFVTPGIVMNRDLYNSLPEDVKKVMEEVNAEYPNQFYQTLVAQEDTDAPMLRQAGVKFAALSPQESQRWRSVVVPALWDKWVAETDAKGLPGKELVDRYTKLIEKYKGQSKYVTAVERFAK